MVGGADAPPGGGELHVGQKARGIGPEMRCWSLSMDWFCWENLNRKPMGFSHEIYGVFRLKCSRLNQSIESQEQQDSKQYGNDKKMTKSTV